MRKILCWLLAAVSVAAPAYGGENYRPMTINGRHLLSGPYNHARAVVPIGGAKQLAALHTRPGHYALAGDITLPEDWQPIETFSGRLDGGGFTIDSHGRTLFAALDDAHIKNLTLTGALANVITNSEIERCYAIGGAAVSDDGEAGGFTGRSVGSTFTQCYARRPAAEGAYAGGFAGRAVSCVFDGCGVEGGTARGAVAGGFVGASEGARLTANAKHTAVMRDCHSSGAVTALRYGGGFAGELRCSFVSDCAAYGPVNAEGKAARAAGGFCGRAADYSRVVYASAAGAVDGATGSTGGFVGLVTKAACVEYALSSGDVTGRRAVGGFVGRLAADGPNTVSHCLSLARFVIGGGDGCTRRFAGRLDREGVDDCRAYFGAVVLSDRGMAALLPGPYTADAADAPALPLDPFIGYTTRKRF